MDQKQSAKFVRTLGLTVIAVTVTALVVKAAADIQNN